MLRVEKRKKIAHYNHIKGILQQVPIFVFEPIQNVSNIASFFAKLYYVKIYTLVQDLLQQTFIGLEFFLLKFDLSSFKARTTIL